MNDRQVILRLLRLLAQVEDAAAAATDAELRVMVAQLCADARADLRDGGR